MNPCDHPHPDPAHLARVYRSKILSAKRAYGTARGLVHYHDYIQGYLGAKLRMFRRLFP